MSSFRQIDQKLGRVGSGIALSLGSIMEHKGRAELHRVQNRESLTRLSRVARVQSVEASNAIEGITAPLRRIQALAAEKVQPQNRSEQEIAGYRAALDMIHSSAPDIPFRPNVVLQLHRDLLHFTTEPGGHWKASDNEVVEDLPDGTRRVRFKPVEAWRTADAMEGLHEGFDRAVEAGDHSPLLLVGAYVLDFTVIHPFADGNGRMSRLLTLLALYHRGFDVGRYVSLEKLIDDSRDTYYESLAASTAGWHEGEHDLEPWLDYFLGLLNAAYKRFEAGLDVVTGPGAKTAAVRSFVRASVAQTFAFADVRRAVPGASDALIRVALSSLREEGVLELEGRGRGARWKRVRDEFVV